MHIKNGGPSHTRTYTRNKTNRPVMMVYPFFKLLSLASTHAKRSSSGGGTTLHPLAASKFCTASRVQRALSRLRPQKRQEKCGGGGGQRQCCAYSRKAPARAHTKTPGMFIFFPLHRCCIWTIRRRRRLLTSFSLAPLCVLLLLLLRRAGLQFSPARVGYGL